MQFEVKFCDRNPQHPEEGRPSTPQAEITSRVYFRWKLMKRPWDGLLWGCMVRSFRRRFQNFETLCETSFADDLHRVIQDL
jgi:hypothetical protein